MFQTEQDRIGITNDFINVSPPVPADCPLCCGCCCGWVRQGPRGPGKGWVADRLSLCVCTCGVVVVRGAVAENVRRRRARAEVHGPGERDGREERVAADLVPERPASASGVARPVSGRCWGWGAGPGVPGGYTGTATTIIRALFCAHSDAVGAWYGPVCCRSHSTTWTRSSGAWRR